MGEKEILLQVTGLTKSYKELVAVDQINFEVYRGEVFGLLGPNGAGKTTTIRMLCGLLGKDQGQVLINGSSLDNDYGHVKTQIGLCPQDIVVWRLMTCMEQLVFSGVSYGMKPKKAKERSVYLLEALGLTDKSNKLAKTLSGGMQRRLNIALALVHDPELIILDEPQAGLDPQSRILVRDFIRQLAKDKTVILTTHDMDEADRLSDRVAIIDHGHILMLDKPEAIKASTGTGDILQIHVGDLGEDELSERHMTAIEEAIDFEYDKLTCSDGFLYLDAPDLMTCVPKISKVFESLALTIEDMTVRKRTLEDAFIAMTGRGLRE